MSVQRFTAMHCTAYTPALLRNIIWVASPHTWCVGLDRPFEVLCGVFGRMSLNNSFRV
ncbi:hypothetical protein F383_18377 [Gossypium arboreum]|uniref:Uncharacterized protein n=1 Tax=Gossypium arboreum TaxID=29729 RepID=A0A0B0NL92_GOSAR|nr:hypothetical protein F383_18377 [Gossypium arboreum]